MTRARFYTFTSPDGKVEMLTLAEAYARKEEYIIKRIKEIRYNVSNKRMSKDGFTPGWQENVQAYAGGRQEYAKILKDKGLVEIGYDHTPTESNPNLHPCANEAFATAIKDAGIPMEDNELDAVISGEYFED